MTAEAYIRFNQNKARKMRGEKIRRAMFILMTAFLGIEGVLVYLAFFQY